jgi:hypothetical protein
MHENTPAGAMLRFDAVVVSKRLRSSCEAKVSRELDDHDRIRGPRSLAPLGVLRQETRDEGCIGDRGLALILAKPQEATASRAVFVEIHHRMERWVRKRNA